MARVVSPDIVDPHTRGGNFIYGPEGPAEATAEPAHEPVSEPAPYPGSWGERPEPPTASGATARRPDAPQPSDTPRPEQLSANDGREEAKWDIDPNIFRRIRRGEANSFEYGKSRTIIDRDKGFYGLVDDVNYNEAQRTGRSGGAAKQIARTLAKGLRENFNPKQPVASLRNIFQAAQRQVEKRGENRAHNEDLLTGAAGVLQFVKTEGDVEHDIAPRLDVVYGYSGDVRIIRGSAVNRRVDQLGGATHTADYFSNDPDTFDPQVGLVDDLQPGERFFILSDSLVDDGTTRHITEGDLQAAFQIADPEEAAQYLLQRNNGPYDRGVVAVDVPETFEATGEGEKLEPIRGTIMDRINTRILLGVAALGGRREKYFRNHREEYPEDMPEPEARRLMQEKRERRGYKILVGGLALIGAGFVAKHYGLDIMPSKFDGDGVDLLPFHGKSHFHGTSPTDSRDGFWGWLWDDDPAFPKKAHDTIHTSTRPFYDFGTGGMNTPGAPSEAIVVPHGGSQTQVFQDYLHDHGVDVSRTEAYRDYLSEEAQYGPTGTYFDPTHAGSDVYNTSVPGDVRISAPTDNGRLPAPVVRDLKEKYPSLTD